MLSRNTGMQVKSEGTKLLIMGMVDEDQLDWVIQSGVSSSCSH